MKLDQLLLLSVDSELMVSNDPFAYAGKATLELDGGDAREWLFSSDGSLLAVAPADEEVAFFRLLDEEIEAENETVGYHGKDYEFSYEDVGTVGTVDGEARVEADERYTLTDYEADDGETIRLVRNENTGDVLAFLGSVVSEDDVVAVE